MTRVYVALFFVQLGWLSTFGRAQCVLPPAVEAQLQRYTAEQQQFESDPQWEQLTAKAFTEIDVPSCTDAAIADFKKFATWEKAPPDARGMAAGALEYLAAIQKWQRGDTAAAIAGLHQVVEKYVITSVQDRAITMLIFLTANDPSSKEWNLLTPILEERSTLNDGAGYALSGIELLAKHDLALAHNPQGQARILGFLAKPLHMQDRFQAQILLLEYLVAERDFDSAQVLTTAVDSDFGRQLLAPEWRVRYLRGCVTAWSASSTADGRQRLARYQRGLQTAQGETL